MHVVLRLGAAPSAIVVPVSNGTTIESLAKVIAARAKVDQVELYAASGAQFHFEDDAAEILAHNEQIVAFVDPIQATQHQRQLLASDFVQCSDLDQGQPPLSHLWQTARPAGFIFLILLVVAMAGYSQLHSPPASTVFDLSASTVAGPNTAPLHSATASFDVDLPTAAPVASATPSPSVNPAERGDTEAGIEAGLPTTSPTSEPPTTSPISEPPTAPSTSEPDYSSSANYWADQAYMYGKYPEQRDHLYQAVLAVELALRKAKYDEIVAAAGTIPTTSTLELTRFGVEPASTTNCATRDMAIVEELLTSPSLTPEMRGRTGMVEKCNAEPREDRLLGALLFVAPIRGQWLRQSDIANDQRDPLCSEERLRRALYA